MVSFELQSPEKRQHPKARSSPTLDFLISELTSKINEQVGNMSSGTRGLWSSEGEQRLGMAEKGSIDCTVIRTAA